MSRLWLRLTNRHRLWRFLPCPLAHRWRPEVVNACLVAECTRCTALVVLWDFADGERDE